ncbi:adenylate cyclase [Solemya pervernicosa gill symbiont]|uniref:Adenylate cyclase n=2 Tax=Gammaproteobacteria incertae sedis TaxID=118884 RepID=A0A1T2LAB5_9GAMM|nr:CYTH domain-containing protein [Candidatus Reidiella endopervernicosa]OOZ42043.1 adenylate cyclase [Solemya pervernicosa gill symbiont]QKQ27011.1 CYTH domain-containing protein [Candidatus Reidiella endopervernicosa]
MAKEIERKFLLRDESWLGEVVREIPYRQGYLANTEEVSVRIRISGESAKLNIKSATLGIERHEYEYAIPVEEGQEMLDNLCKGPIIEKVRHIVKRGGHTWEIDRFSGENEGLVVAEIELASTDEAFERPVWLGDEVSSDTRYYNSCLVNHPYKDW